MGILDLPKILLYAKRGAKWKSRHLIIHLTQALVDSGKVRSIGVSNYNMIPFLDLMSYARIPPAVNQVSREVFDLLSQLEVHPYNTRKELTDFVRSKGVVVESYSTLGSGKIGPLEDQTIQTIAKKYKKVFPLFSSLTQR